MSAEMWTAVGVATDASRMVDGRSVYTVTYADSSEIAPIWAECGDD